MIMICNKAMPFGNVVLLSVVRVSHTDALFQSKDTYAKLPSCLATFAGTYFHFIAFRLVW